MFNVGDRVIYVGNTKGSSMIREKVGHLGVVMKTGQVGPRGPMVDVMWDKADRYGEKNTYAYLFNIELEEQKPIPGDDDDDCI